MLCVWSARGELLWKIEAAHGGAEIWSIDVDRENKYIYTGGADGALNVWPLVRATAAGGFADANDELPKEPRHVCYTKSGRILALLDTAIPMSSDGIKIQISSQLARYRDYCVFKLSPDRTRIALGSIDGHVGIYRGACRISFPLCLQIHFRLLFPQRTLPRKPAI